MVRQRRICSECRRQEATLGGSGACPPKICENRKAIDAFWWHFGGWVEVKSAEICMVRQRRVCSECRRHEATLGGSGGMPPPKICENREAIDAFWWHFGGYFLIHIDKNV